MVEVEPVELVEVVEVVDVVEVVELVGLVELVEVVCAWAEETPNVEEAAIPARLTPQSDRRRAIE